MALTEDFGCAVASVTQGRGTIANKRKRQRLSTKSKHHMRLRLPSGRVGLMLLGLSLLALATSEVCFGKDLTMEFQPGMYSGETKVAAGTNYCDVQDPPEPESLTWWAGECPQSGYEAQYAMELWEVNYVRAYTSGVEVCIPGWPFAHTDWEAEDTQPVGTVNFGHADPADDSPVSDGIGIAHAVPDEPGGYPLVSFCVSTHTLTWWWEWGVWSFGEHIIDDFDSFCWNLNNPLDEQCVGG